jgi:hypothetical protein
MFGLGGIFVEVLKDVALRLAPIDKADALSMIAIKGAILDGARAAARHTDTLPMRLSASRNSRRRADDIESIDISRSSSCRAAQRLCARRAGRLRQHALNMSTGPSLRGLR